MTTPPEPRPVGPFTVRADGRWFRIAPDSPFPEAQNSAGDNEWFVPVNCTDVNDPNCTAQAIVEGTVSQHYAELVADEQVRDAIANAAGQYGHAALPDGFAITLQ